MKKVLFLCIGNSCRSQMAEGFARRYGSDVLIPFSAGLAPAAIVQSLTKKVMADKNINLDAQFPKELSQIDTAALDLIINMSGHPMPPGSPVEIREWKVEDPIGRSEEVYVTVRDQIENLVMRLILELRQKGKAAPVRPARHALRGTHRSS